MKQTEHLKLNKPDLEDYVKVSDINENMDILDNTLMSMSEGSEELETTVVKHGEELAKHKVDYVAHPGYANTTGTNAYSVTLSPKPTALVAGMGVVFKVGTTSTGKCTLNVNGLGAKPIVDSNGDQVDDLVGGSVYTVRYGSTSFILQGKGGGSTDIVALREKIYKIIGKDKLYSVNLQDGYMIVDGGDGYPNGMRALDLNGTLIHSLLSFTDAVRYATYNKMALFRTTIDSLIVRAYDHKGTVMVDVYKSKGWWYDFGGMDESGNYVLLNYDLLVSGLVSLTAELYTASGTLIKKYDKYDFSISVINNNSGRLNNNYFQSGRFMSKGNKIYVDVASST
ncbi:hypothetical protein LGW19_10135, partial [Streptococcus mutans]|nr:hypothetical protein [Streptococcus mutans]